MAGFSLEIYFQMVHSTIGSPLYAPLLNVKLEARIVTAMGLGSDPNGAFTKIYHIQMHTNGANHPLKA